MGKVLKFASRPLAKEAIQLTHENLKDIWEWMGDAYTGHGTTGNDQHLTIPIKTLEGEMTANEGDWIVKGIRGEFYPIKNDIFEAQYFAVEE